MAIPGDTAAGVGVMRPVHAWCLRHSAWVTAARLGGSSGLWASRLSTHPSRAAGRGWRARGVAQDGRLSFPGSTAAAAMGDSSTGGLSDDPLRPPSPSGVLQGSSRKNDVIHP